MKKVISLILSMAMVLSLTVLSFAAGDGPYSITITNKDSGHVYEAYQIFAGTISQKTDDDGKTIKILSDITWGSGVNPSPEGKEQLGDAATIAENLTNGTLDAKTFAKQLVDDGYLTNATTSGNTSNPYVISGLEAGYYLVKDQNKELNKGDAYTSYILQVVGNVSMNPKSAGTTSQKKVKDINDSDGNGETNWQDSADYDIEDLVPFQLTGTVASNYDSYKVYKFAFHDQMSAGLTFDKSSVEVSVDGNKIDSGYEVVTEGLDDGCTFEVRFADLKKIASVHGGSVITVEYKAELNNDAVRGSVGNPNTSYLEYSNNPNDDQGGQTGKTPEDTVIVFTYKTVINKVGPDGTTPLKGAIFTLEKKIAGTPETWTKIKTVETIDKNTTTFTFDGLDDGEYRLKETQAPDGYNKINDYIYFTVTATHVETADNPTLTDLKATQTDAEGTDLTEGVIATFAKVYEKVSADSEETKLTGLSTNIVNKSGTTLPETGGIGTKIFYVVGAVLVIGAGVLFVTKRRMSAR